MAKDVTTTLRFKAEVGDFKNAMREAEAAVKQANAEFRKAVNGMDDWRKSENGLTAKLKQLDALLQGQQRKAEILAEKYRLVAKEQGEDSEAAKKLKTQLTNQEAAIEKTKKEIDKYGKSLKDIKSESSSLTAKIEDQRKTLDKLKKEYAETVAKEGKHSKSARDLAKDIRKCSAELAKDEKAMSKAEKAADRLDNSSVDAAAGQTKLGRAAKIAGAALGALKSVGGGLIGGFKNLVGSIIPAGDAISGMKEKVSALTVAMGELVADGIRAVIDKAKEIGTDTLGVGKGYEQSMSKVKALSGATAKDMTKLGAKAKEMAAATKYNTQDAADAYSYMALAGWDANQMLENIQPILDLAAASEMDLAEASDVVTDYLTAFNDKSLTAAHLADLMAKAMSTSNTSTEQLAEAYKNCASTAGSMGYAAEDVTAALATMANSGIKGGEAGTALNAVMTRLATDTRSCASTLAEYGVNVYDAEGNMQSLSSILNGISGVWANLSDQQQANLAKAIAGQNAYSDFSAIMTGCSDAAAETGKSFNDYAEALRNADGAAQEMAETMQDNLEGDLTKLSSALNVIQTNLYEKFAAPMREIVQELTAEVTPELQNFIDGVEGSGAAMVNALDSIIRGGLEKLSALSTGGATNGMLDAIIGNLSALVTDFAPGIISGISTLISNILDTLKAHAQEIATAAGTIFSSIATAILDNLPLIISTIGTFISTFLGELAARLPEITQTLREKAPEIRAAASEALNGILQAGGDLAAVLPEMITTLFDLVKGLVQDNAPAIKEAITAIIDGLTEFLGMIWTEYGDDISAALLSVMKAVADILGQFWNEHGDEIIAMVKTVIGNIAKQLGLDLPHILWAIVKGLASVGKVIGDFIIDVDKLLLSLPAKLINWGIKLMLSLAQGILSGISHVGEALGHIAGEIWKAIQSLIDGAVQAGKDFIDGIISGIKSKAADIKNAVSDIMPDLPNVGGVIGGAKDKLSGLFGGGSGSGSSSTTNTYTYNFTQNNSSPKALNRRDIYRQTQRQLAGVQY